MKKSLLSNIININECINVVKKPYCKKISLYGILPLIRSKAFEYNNPK